MEKETVALLQQLASKLGTTTEYLWGVLIKQAPINAAISLIQAVLVFLYGHVLYRLHIKFMKNYSYIEYDVFLGVPMVIGSLIFAILMICVLFDITNILTGFVNPEYWALQRVLDAIKGGSK